jgi:multidrug efflux system outer membrane protein
MRKILFLIFAVVFLLLGGCSLAPEYSRPQAPVPEQWPQGEAYKKAQDAPGTTPVAEIKWQDFFTDDQLRQIVTMALANNRDLRLAALNVERARALYGIQRAELVPAVDAAGGYAKQRTSADLTQPGKPRTTEKYSVDLGIASWEIDFFGRLRNLTEQALQEYMATEQARRSAQIALVSEVARVYLTFAADRESLKLAQSTLESQLDAYKLIKKRYDAGVATELDLRRAEAPVESAKVDMAFYRRAVAVDHNALNLLAGSPVPKELLPADLDSLKPCKDISVGLSSEVLLHRPDIIAAEHRLKGAYAFIGAARAAFFPRITLTTSIGTASNELSGLFGASSDTWSFVPRIVMPIFDARTWAALRVSKADQKIILTQYEKTIQAAFRDVADTLAVQGTIDPQVAAQQALVKAYAESYRLSSRRYLKGIDSYLGVLDAQRSLFQAQKGLVTLRLAKLANQVRLYAVLGGGSD